MTAVHHGDPGIGFGKQGINEGHGRGAGTDHQIICVDFIHAHFLFSQNNLCYLAALPSRQ